MQVAPAIKHQDMPRTTTARPDADRAWCSVGPAIRREIGLVTIAAASTLGPLLAMWGGNSGPMPAPTNTGTDGNGQQCLIAPRAQTCSGAATMDLLAPHMAHTTQSVESASSRVTVSNTTPNSMKLLATTGPILVLAVGSCLVISRHAWVGGLLLGIGAGVALSGSV